MKNKILAMLLAAVMVAAMLPTAFAAADYESKTFKSKYSWSTSTMTIDKVLTGYPEWETHVPAEFTVTYTPAYDGAFCIHKSHNGLDKSKFETDKILAN